MTRTMMDDMLEATGDESEGALEARLGVVHDITRAVKRMVKAHLLRQELLDADVPRLAAAALLLEQYAEEVSDRLRERRMRPTRKPKPSPVDRHIARASDPAKTTIPRRRGRAPSSGQPCAPGSPRHRFGSDGACRVPGCSVRRAEKGSQAAPASAPPAQPSPAPAPAATRALRRMRIEMPDGTVVHPPAAEDANV